MALSKQAAAARLAAMVLVGAVVAAGLYYFRSPLTVSEREVKALVDKRRLLGLSLEEAGKKLQHRVPNLQDGLVVLDFKQVKGWEAGPLTLDVRDGKVAAVMWGDAPSNED